MRSSKIAPKKVGKIAHKSTRRIQKAVPAEATEKNTKGLNCDIPRDVYKRFQLKAVREDISISALVNKWVREYIK